MDVIGAMKARRSVRSYLPRKVEQEKLNAVLEAVRLTPSRHNDQNIRVIVVRDSALKQQIRQQAETQPMVEEALVLSKDVNLALELGVLRYGPHRFCNALRAIWLCSGHVSGHRICSAGSGRTGVRYVYHLCI